MKAVTYIVFYMLVAATIGILVLAPNARAFAIVFGVLAVGVALVLWHPAGRRVFARNTHTTGNANRYRRP